MSVILKFIIIIITTTMTMTMTMTTMTWMMTHQAQLAQTFQGCDSVIACPGSRQSGIARTCGIGARKATGATGATGYGRGEDLGDLNSKNQGGLNGGRVEHQTWRFKQSCGLNHFNSGLYHSVTNHRKNHDVIKHDLKPHATRNILKYII